MTAPPLCVRCEKPTPDGTACTSCMSRARRLLTGDPRDDSRPGITDAAPAARAVAYGLTRTGNGAGGGAGPGIPLDPDAVERLHAVQNTLTAWARLVAEERGIEIGHG